MIDRRWQVAGGDVRWHPDWVGVGNELIELDGLYPASVYGVRVSAVNRQGRSWSPTSLFRTISGIPCEQGMREEWVEGGLIDELETRRLCGPGLEPNLRDPDARDEACSAGYFSYILAGLAAGAVMALVFASMFLRNSWAKRLLHMLPEAEATQRLTSSDRAPASGIAAAFHAATLQTVPASDAVPCLQSGAASDGHANGLPSAAAPSARCCGYSGSSTGSEGAARTPCTAALNRWKDTTPRCTPPSSTAADPTRSSGTRSASCGGGSSGSERPSTELSSPQ